MRASAGADTGPPSISSVATFHAPCNLSRSVIGILVDDELEVSRMFALGLNLDTLSGRLIGLEKLGIVQDGVRVHLVPGEDLVTAGRDAAESEVASRIGG